MGQARFSYIRARIECPFWAAQARQCPPVAAMAQSKAPILLRQGAMSCNPKSALEVSPLLCWATGSRAVD